MLLRCLQSLHVCCIKALCWQLHEIIFWAYFEFLLLWCLSGNVLFEMKVFYFCQSVLMYLDHTILILTSHSGLKFLCVPYIIFCQRKSSGFVRTFAKGIKLSSFKCAHLLFFLLSHPLHGESRPVMISGLNLSLLGSEHQLSYCHN